MRFLCRRERSRSKFIKADGHGLAQVHGGLLAVRRNFDEQMAERQVFAGEAVLLRSKDDGDAASVCQFPLHEWTEIGKSNHGLPGFAVGQGSCAKYQPATSPRPDTS